jgi:diguanylate cyclase (GGDEF)-like protein
MYELDVLSSYAICGAGALLGAAVLRPALAPDAGGREALTLARVAYIQLGAALVMPVFGDGQVGPAGQVLLAGGSMGAVVTAAYAFSALAGRVRERWGLALSLAVAWCAALAGGAFGTGGLAIVGASGLLVANAMMATMARRLVLRPRDLHERLVGGLIVLMLLSCIVRSALTFTWNGPPLPHLLHMPPAVVTPFALLYGVMPIVFALLMLNVVHARLHQRLHERAMTDELTGALSRRALNETSGALIARLRHQGQRLAVVMIDIDHFKQVNDRHGHAAGDSVLRQAGELLRTELRGDALLARYGGEEFVALVPVPDLPSARRAAERMRLAVLQRQWGAELPPETQVTASLGVSLLAADESLEAALARADEALYRAKHAGRNQVQVELVAA